MSTAGQKSAVHTDTYVIQLDSGCHYWRNLLLLNVRRYSESVLNEPSPDVR